MKSKIKFLITLALLLLIGWTNNNAQTNNSFLLAGNSRVRVIDNQWANPEADYIRRCLSMTITLRQQLQRLDHAAVEQNT